MLEIKDAVVGTKQVVRAMQAGELRYVYIADDAQAHVRNKLLAAAEEFGVAVRSAPTMKELGKACKIDVGAAAVGVKRS